MLHLKVCIFYFYIWQYLFRLWFINLFNFSNLTKCYYKFQAAESSGFCFALMFQRYGLLVHSLNTFHWFDFFQHTALCNNLLLIKVSLDNIILIKHFKIRIIDPLLIIALNYIYTSVNRNSFKSAIRMPVFVYTHEQFISIYVSRPAYFHYIAT